MGNNAKINVVEKILMAFLVVSADAADFLAAVAVGIPVIGWGMPFASWFYGTFISIIIIFWLIMKGVNPKRFLWGGGIELLPFLNALPARLAALIAVFIQDSAPTLIKKGVKPIKYESHT